MTESLNLRQKLRARLQSEWDQAPCETAPFNAAAWADAVLAEIRTFLAEPGDEVVEGVALEMCDAPEPRVTADKEDAALFGDQDDDTRKFWRQIARIALSALADGMEGG